MKSILAAILLLSVLASHVFAAPVYTSQQPEGISASEAIKLAKDSGETVSKCQRNRLGDNAAPVKAKGAATIFVRGEVKNEDAALDMIFDGKTAFKCQALVYNPDKRKLVNAN